MLKSKFSVIPKFCHIVARKSSFASLILPKRKIIQPVEYKIEIAKANDIKSTLAFIEKNFFFNEPLSASLNITRSNLNGSFEIFTLDGIKQGMTLIAKTDNKDIIAACVNMRSCKFDESIYQEFVNCTSSEKAKKLFHVWSILSREPRLHEELKQRCIFETKMLAVKDIHQGQGLGTELVKKSLILARDLNFSHASMNCTSEYAKKIAEKFDMKKVWEVAYKNILLNDEKTPITTPIYPHLSASVLYLNLK